MKHKPLNKNLIDLVETLLDENHPLNFNMQGYSMFPTLQEGDRGIVEKWNPEDLVAGDIVVFKANNKLVAHRLIQITIRDGVRWFTAKGDKNTFTDEPFTAESFVGKMTSFQRNNRLRRLDSPGMKTQQYIALHFSTISIYCYNLILGLKNRFEILKSGWKSLKKNLLPGIQAKRCWLMLLYQLCRGFFLS